MPSAPRPTPNSDRFPALAAAIRAARARRGLSQAAAAAAFGVARWTWIGWEAAKRSPAQPTARRLAAEWSIPEDLLGLSDGPSCPTCRRPL